MLWAVGHELQLAVAIRMLPHLHLQTSHTTTERVVCSVTACTLDLGAHALAADTAAELPPLLLDGLDANDGLHSGEV